TIAYTAPVASRATVRIYDAAGRLVRSLADGAVDAGRHTMQWDGRAGSGERASAGVYFVRLEAPGSRVEMRKVHVLR
ncbi:T9SS type A sorting domain-containing protein, partial [bacterium]|nr:T9SS type A sorting domain-containing protein [bacterium]